MKLQRFLLRRPLRCSLFLAGAFGFIYYIKSFYFRPTEGPTDLRKYEGLPIISPAIEPRDRPQKNLFILVIISSSPNSRKHAAKRIMLRRTWANANEARMPSNATFKIVFMMGRSLNSEMNRAVMEEYEEHGDILIGDYKDTYRNITTKLLMAFQWAAKMKCSYILKTDDDVYVDIPMLVIWLKGRGGQGSFLYGGVTYESYVVRRKSHRHYVSPDELALDRYPLFCKGSMFLLSWNLLPKMVHLSKQIWRIGPDDAYVGLLAQHLGVKPIYIPEFFQNSFMTWLIRFISTCELQRLMGIGDSLTPNQLLYIHQLKITLSNSERLSLVCVGLNVKFWILLLCFCTLLLSFCTIFLCG